MSFYVLLDLFRKEIFFKANNEKKNIGNSSKSPKF